MLADRILEVMIPGKVTGKGRPRFVRATGRAYTPEATLSAENMIKVLLRQGYEGALLEEPLCLRVTVFCDVPKSKSKKFRALALADNYIPTTKPDLDNVVKLVGDAGNGIVWKDDSHIAEVHARRRYGDAPALHITVERCVG